MGAAGGAGGGWEYTDGATRPRAWDTLLWEAGAVAVAHIFLWPAAALGCLVALHAVAPAAAWGVALAYAGWMVADRGAPRSGARYTPAFVRGWVKCHHTFPVRTLLWTGAGYSHVPVPEHAAVYDTERQTYIFAMAPHGAIPIGAAVFGPQIARWPAIASRLRVGVHSALFSIPILRDFYLAFGAVDASRATLLHQLTAQRRSVMLLPGGVREQLLVCAPGTEGVVLRDRRGFVRLALETGSHLVPVVVFGERQAYRLNDGWTLALSRLIKRYTGIGLPLPRGRWWTLMWLPTPITIVCGRPIPVARTEAPSPAAVDSLHAAFVAALTDLFNEHKAAAGYAHVRLDVQ